MDAVSYVFTFIEGVLTFVSPCTLPLLPVYVSYLAGMSGSYETAGARGGRGVILNSVAFVLGFTLIFVALGATAKSVGGLLGGNMDLFRKISGIVMVLFGLYFMGVFKFRFLNFQKSIDYQFNELKFLNSAVFGMVFGFSWTPCRGVFLGNALIMAGNTDTIVDGMLLLFMYSMGLGIPFILAALLFENLTGALDMLKNYQRIISVISGIVLISGGVLVYTDNLKYLGFVAW